MTSDNIRYGVIDIGSNSTRLLLCDADGQNILRPLRKKLITTRLSQGIVSTGALSSEAMERTRAAVDTLVQEAQEAGAAPIFAFATAAVREAANRDEFIRIMHRSTRLLIDVLPEEVEAQAGFMGAYRPGSRCVVDIGGASTEIALGEGDTLHHAVSVCMGAVRALEKYPLGDIADPLSLQAMQQWAHNVLRSEAPDLPQWLAQTPPQAASGVGGTITTLAAMDRQLLRYDPAMVQDYALTRHTVDRMIKKLCEMPLEARRQIPGLQPERADIIIGGAVILQQVMRAMDLTQIIVSDRDNLEGYLQLRLNAQEET
ncbi:MAG: Ppx/GppA phosphatase family protein [Eubacteriales bacterium]|nr:Ppx/GppA phosphatase family protein [Eubacteriales bacterium]